MLICPSRAAVLLLAVAATGCGHSDPFGAIASTPLDGPLSTTAPIRLTFDNGMDRFATWSADQQRIWYSFQPGERSDGDVCLASMPATGGTRTEYCPTASGQRLVRDAYERATPGPNGQLIYGRYTSEIGMLTLFKGSIDLATVDAPLAGRELLSLPNNIGGVGFNHVGRMQWLASDHLILVAEDETVVPHCISCAKRDTIFIGLALLDGRVTPTGATFSVIPGTLHANDFALSAAGDSIYFTQSEDPDNFTGRSSTLSRVPVGGGSPQVVYSTAGGLFSLARAGSQFIVALANRVAKVDPVAGTSFNIVSNGLNGNRGYGTVSTGADGCRVLAEFARPQGQTFETNVYLLPPNLVGCAP